MGMSTELHLHDESTVSTRAWGTPTQPSPTQRPYITLEIAHGPDVVRFFVSSVSVLRRLARATEDAIVELATAKMWADATSQLLSPDEAA
jgi:hypothetical protein